MTYPPTAGLAPDDAHAVLEELVRIRRLARDSYADVLNSGRYPKGTPGDMHFVTAHANAEQDYVQAAAFLAATRPPRLLDCCGGLGGEYPDHLFWCARLVHPSAA